MAIFIGGIGKRNNLRIRLITNIGVNNIIAIYLSKYQIYDQDNRFFRQIKKLL